MITKKVKGKPAPWLTSDVKVMMNERDKLLRKSRRTSSEVHISAYKRKRNEVNKAIQRAKSIYNRNLLRENSNDPKKFWKTLKSIYPTKGRDKPSMRSFDINGVKTSNPRTISNAFCTFFASVVKSLKKKAIPLRDFIWRKPAGITKKTEKSFLFQSVSQLEVLRILKSIKRNKATGLDDLPPCLLKDSAAILSAPLAHLINLSITTGIFPMDWKKAKIIPVHKSGPFSVLDNYRPISILPVISKIIEKAIHRQLITYLDQNALLSHFQFGFRPKLSTELAATHLLDNIRKSVDDGKLVGAVFIDLSKAFDTISHSKLLEKLPKYGIDGKEYAWFKDYLFARKAVVSYNNCVSDEKELYSGVPQGSILGPLLFIMLFNDITDAIRHSRIVKYADDTVIYFADKDSKSIQSNLTEDMDLISNWLKENELIINMKEGKTEALLFGTAKRISMQTEPFKVYQGSNAIRNTDEYKYLGMYVNSSLDLNSHFERSYKKAAGRLRLLARLRKYLDSQSARDVYCSMIMPVFTYCGVLQMKLSETKMKQLKAFHDRCLKIVYDGEKSNEGLPSVMNANKIRACKLVRKCIDKDICDIFKDYFAIQDHGKETRNATNSLKMPKIRTEYARKSFYYTGAKIYNELPLKIRKITNATAYENSLKDHFS